MSERRLKDRTVGDIVDGIRIKRSAPPKHSGGKLRTLLKLLKWVLFVLLPILVVWGAVKNSLNDLAAQYNYVVTHPVAAGNPPLPIEPHFNVWSGVDELFAWIPTVLSSLGDLFAWLGFKGIVIIVLVVVVLWLVLRTPAAAPAAPPAHAPETRKTPPTTAP